MEQKDLLNRQRETIHFNESCGENLNLIKTNKKNPPSKQNKQTTRNLPQTSVETNFPGSSFMTKAHFT